MPSSFFLVNEYGLVQAVLYMVMILDPCSRFG